MANIEGRAKEYAQQYDEKYQVAMFKAYIDAATEQKKIDEAKYKKLRALAYDIYTSAQYLSTDASKLRKAMDAFHQYVCYEESKEE